MAMHPELEHALSSGVPIREVIDIFAKYHSGWIQEGWQRIVNSWRLNHNKGHSDCLFWDDWHPLFRSLLWTRYSVSYPDTPSEPFVEIHKALTRQIISWLCDSKRKSNVYLIVEPHISALHAYKNCRANVIANICSNAQRLAFAVQFPGGIRPLSLRLAAVFPPFRRILTNVLIDISRIRELPTRTQFKKLIYEPWRALQESHPEYVTPPPVIVLRCNPTYFNEELLRSICEFCSSPHSLSLLWIVSFDTTFRLPVQDLLGLPTPIECFRLPMSYDEGPADAALILHHDFSAIRSWYPEMFDEDGMWPSEKQMSELSRVVLGVFNFVDVIVRFVDSTDGGGPKAHLETFLAYMVDSPSPSDDQPYCALDHFYIRALSDIPPALLPIVKKAFGIVRSRGYARVNPFELACLLSLDEGAILPLLYRLVMTRRVREYEYNSCFQSFLEDPRRSGRFYTPISESDHHAVHACLHILRHSSNFTVVVKPVEQWIQVDEDSPLAYPFWRPRILACRWLCDIPLNEAFVESLRGFDFRCLAHNCDRFRGDPFLTFIKNLHALDKANSPNIARVEPVWSLDRQFIDKCNGIAEPLDLKEKCGFPSHPKYALLGFEAETVLVLLSLRRHEEVDWVTVVNVYTSAMLDYM